MKEIPLTQGKVAIVDDEYFDLLMQYKWCAVRQGHVFYAATKANGNRGVKMHHYIIGYPLHGLVVDHINRNGLDNRKANLRIVSIAQNTMNSRIYETNRSGIRGVRYCKYHKKWVARVVSKYHPFQGYFLTKEEAVAAYEEHAKVFFP